MKRYPVWTETEFRILLANESLSDEEVAKLVGRTKGAVGWVRAGIKKWRNEKELHGILNKMMIRVLSQESQ